MWNTNRRRRKTNVKSKLLVTIVQNVVKQTGIWHGTPTMELLRKCNATNFLRHAILVKTTTTATTIQQQCLFSFIVKIKQRNKMKKKKKQKLYAMKWSEKMLRSTLDKSHPKKHFQTELNRTEQHKTEQNRIELN